MMHSTEWPNEKQQPNRQEMFEKGSKLCSQAIVDIFDMFLDILSWLSFLGLSKDLPITIEFGRNYKIMIPESLNA